MICFQFFPLGQAVPCSVTDPVDPLFKGLPKEFEVGLYHSWAVDPATLPNELRVTAISENHVIMAIRHAQYNVCGVQFHPESVLTPHGGRIIANWVSE